MAKIFRPTKQERESRSAMVSVGLPGTLADSNLNSSPNWGLVVNRPIGGHGDEVDVRTSSIDEEGEVADISLGRHALGWGGSASATMG